MKNILVSLMGSILAFFVVVSHASTENNKVRSPSHKVAKVGDCAQSCGDPSDCPHGKLDPHTQLPKAMQCVNSCCVPTCVACDRSGLCPQVDKGDLVCGYAYCCFWDQY